MDSGVKIRLNTMVDVQRFAQLASEQPEGITIQSERYIINAKSILGILSLDLAQPLTLLDDALRYAWCYDFIIKE